MQSRSSRDSASQETTQMTAREEIKRKIQEAKEKDGNYTKTSYTG